MKYQVKPSIITNQVVSLVKGYSNFNSYLEAEDFTNKRMKQLRLRQSKRRGFNKQSFESH